MIDENEIVEVASQCYIIPTGTEKPVKIVFEGTPITKQFESCDWLYQEQKEI